MEELLENIPAEMHWAITAKILTRLSVLRIHKARPLLGIGEGIIAPIMGWEKYDEINAKIHGEGGKRVLPYVKETFNIPVEDAIGAAKLYIVAVPLHRGPETKMEIVEKSRERVLLRCTKCPWLERVKELKGKLELMVCPEGDQAWAEEGLKAINPKLTYKLTKAMPRGDPYCEVVIEFKEE